MLIFIEAGVPKQFKDFQSALYVQSATECVEFCCLNMETNIHDVLTRIWICMVDSEGIDLFD